MKAIDSRLIVRGVVAESALCFLDEIITIANLVAPVGQISAHAVGLPATTRSGHIMHLRTRGFSDPHSYLGWAKAQATMQ